MELIAGATSCGHAPAAFCHDRQHAKRPPLETPLTGAESSAISLEQLEDALQTARAIFQILVLLRAIGKLRIRWQILYVPSSCVK